MTPVTGDDEDELDLERRMAVNGLYGALFDGPEAEREAQPSEPFGPADTAPTSGETRDE